MRSGDLQGQDVSVREDADQKGTLVTFSIKVPIKEKCVVCEAHHVDLSLPAFKELENPDVGHAKGAAVSVVECRGNSPTTVAGHSPTTSTPTDDVSLVRKPKWHPTFCITASTSNADFGHM